MELIRTPITDQLTYDPEIDEMAPDGLSAHLTLVAALVGDGHIANSQHPSLCAVVLLLLLAVVARVGAGQGLKPLVRSVGVSSGADYVQIFMANPRDLEKV